MDLVFYPPSFYRALLVELEVLTVTDDGVCHNSIVTHGDTVTSVVVNKVTTYDFRLLSPDLMASTILSHYRPGTLIIIKKSGTSLLIAQSLMKWGVGSQTGKETFVPIDQQKFKSRKEESLYFAIDKGWEIIDKNVIQDRFYCDSSGRLMLGPIRNMNCRDRMLVNNAILLLSQYNYS